MAELFGVVGAGIGIAAAAGQLLDGIVKLSTLCAQIRDISKDIQNAVYDLKLQTEMLAVIQPEINAVLSASNVQDQITATRVLDALQKSLGDVELVIGEMQTRVAKKGCWDRVKASGLIARLDKAARHVEVAQQMVLTLLLVQNR